MLTFPPILSTVPERVVGAAKDVREAMLGRGGVVAVHICNVVDGEEVVVEKWVRAAEEVKGCVGDVLVKVYGRGGYEVIGNTVPLDVLLPDKDGDCVYVNGCALAKVENECTVEVECSLEI